VEELGGGAEAVAERAGSGARPVDSGSGDEVGSAGACCLISFDTLGIKVGSGKKGR
jgi:hypothetical protein